MRWEANTRYILLRTNRAIEQCLERLLTTTLLHHNNQKFFHPSTWKTSFALISMSPKMKAWKASEMALPSCLYHCVIESWVSMIFFSNGARLLDSSMSVHVKRKHIYRHIIGALTPCWKSTCKLQVFVMDVLRWWRERDSRSWAEILELRFSTMSCQLFVCRIFAVVADHWSMWREQ